MAIRLHSESISILADPIQYCMLNSAIEGNKKGIEDFNFYKQELEKELIQPSNKFLFHHFSYPKLSIYASAVFGYIKYDDYYKKVYSERPWENVFLHIIPQNDSTEIIIGYHSDCVNDDMLKLASEWDNLDSESLGQKLTEILVNHVEDWGLSPSLYKSIPEAKKQKFINLFEQNILRHESSLSADFNLFS